MRLVVARFAVAEKRSAQKSLATQRRGVARLIGTYI
jgi:hypothetical protein